MPLGKRRAGRCNFRRFLCTAPYVSNETHRSKFSQIKIGQSRFQNWPLGRSGESLGQRRAHRSDAAIASVYAAHTSAGTFFTTTERPSKALFVGAKKKSPRWPEAPTLTAALAPFGITPPTANFLSRYGVYVVPSALKTKDSASYLRMQKVLLQARATPEFQNYIAKSQLHDLSIGRPGEDFESAFAADIVELRKIK